MLIFLTNICTLLTFIHPTLHVKKGKFYSAKFCYFSLVPLSKLSHCVDGAPQDMFFQTLELTNPLLKKKDVASHHSKHRMDTLQVIRSNVPHKSILTWNLTEHILALFH